MRTEIKHFKEKKWFKKQKHKTDGSFLLKRRGSENPNSFKAARFCAIISFINIYFCLFSSFVLTVVFTLQTASPGRDKVQLYQAWWQKQGHCSQVNKNKVQRSYCTIVWNSTIVISIIASVDLVFFGGCFFLFVLLNLSTDAQQQCTRVFKVRLWWCTLAFYCKSFMLVMEQVGPKKIPRFTPDRLKSRILYFIFLFHTSLNCSSVILHKKPTKLM